MKKKFMQIVSMVLAVVMILPAAVFAADYTIEIGETVDLEISLQNIDVDSVNWKSSDSTVASISSTSRAVSSVGSTNTGTYYCEVLGKAEGDAEISINYTQNGSSRTVKTTVQVVGDDLEEDTSVSDTSGGAGSSGNSGNSGNSGSSGSSGTSDGQKEVTSITISIDKTKIYDNGSNNTATVTLTADGDIDESDIIWYTTDKSVAKVSGSGKTATVTGVSDGTAKIKALYGDLTSNLVSVEVDTREIIDFKVEETKKIDLHYYTGQSFDRDGIKVSIKYNDDNKWQETTSYTVSPSGAFTEAGDDVKVTISYPGTNFSKDFYVEVEERKVKSVSIVSPEDNTEVNKNGKIDSITIEVEYNDGDDEEITVTKSNAASKGVTVNNYTLGNSITKDTAITATYGNVTSDPVLIKVKSSTTLSGLTVTASSSAKTEYYVGESFKSTGYTFTANYSDGTTKNVTTNLKYSPSSFTTTGNSIPVTITYTENGVSKPATVYVKVSDKINVTGISTASGYKTVVADDAKVKLGDELDWEELFDSVYIKYKNSSGTTKYKEISDEDDLEDWLGSSAELYVIVDDKEGSKADIVEEDDIDDGKVDLKLYLDYAGTKYSYSFDMEVSDVACTVTVYRSNGTTKIGDSKVFDDLEEALEYLEDKDDIVKDFGVSSTYKNNFVVKIKLGEDQDLDDFEFSPDHDHSITIDLNGYELELESEWIDYNNDSEDIKITVTNTNDDEYGTLIYSDLSTSLIVADGSELEFSEGNIPMDSDAVCTVTIYKNSNSTASSNVIKTKVYDSLSEALEFFEDSEEFEEEFDDELSEKNVITLKLGKDQTLTNFKFAPVFDNTITIDLNGYTLKLKSTWIDYEDCEELVLYVTNTNKDKKATLTYTDLSNSLTVANGDSLKFKDGEIPGIYDVAISSTTNGKVTMSKDTVAHGGTVTFTITPNAGYAISTVKVNNKSITTSTDGYTVNSSTGVGKYEMKNITEDVTIAVTFKASSSSSTGSSSAADWKNTFTDISVKDQYYDAVAFVCSEGLMNGVADNSYTAATKFKPLENMTRAQFVTVLGRLAGIDATKYSGSSFTDVSTTDDAKAAWAAPYIEWAVQNGITNGMGNGKFAPSDPVTHQQMYLMMYRYALYVENVNVSLANVSLTSIKDYTEIADWAEEGVKFASRYGILITSGSKLTPADNALRCELAMLLHGFCKNVLNYNG